MPKNVSILAKASSMASFEKVRRSKRQYQLNLSKKEKSTDLDLNVINLYSLFLNRNTYRKVASSNTSRLEAHAGFFKLLMKGIFDPYLL